MRSAIRALVFGALFSLVFVGCACDPEPPTSNPDPRPVYSAHAFDFAGLCSGEIDRQSLTIENKAPARLSMRFSFEGADASSFRVEREGVEISELAVAGNRSDTIEVVFEPTDGTGEKDAWLVISTNSRKEPEKKILLTAFFSPNPTTPRVSGGWALCNAEDLCPDLEKDDPCCEIPPTDPHLGLVNIGKVGVGHEGSVTLSLENRGCAPVEITGYDIEIDDIGENTCREDDIRVELAEGGAEIPRAVEVEKLDLQVVFEPGGSCTLTGRIFLQTSDPERPSLRFDVQGEGVAGSLLVSSPGDPVNFGDVPKGSSKPIPVQLTNVGTDAVEVTEIRLTGDDAEHFEIVAVEQCGSEVPLPLEIESIFKTCGNPETEDCCIVPGEDPETCEKKPPKCEGEIELITHYEPKSGGLHGYGGTARIFLSEAAGYDSIVRLQGRSEPKVAVYPSTMISFSEPKATACGDDYTCGSCINGFSSCGNDAECEEGWKCLDSVCTKQGNESSQAVCATTCGAARRTVKVCNEGINDLEIESILVYDQGFFEAGKPPGSPVDNDPFSDTFGEDLFVLDASDCELGPLPPATCCEATIDLHDGRGGGEKFAELVVETNAGDPRVITIRKMTESVGLKPPTVVEYSQDKNPLVGDTLDIFATLSVPYGEITNLIWEIESVEGASNIIPGVLVPGMTSENCRTEAPWGPSNANCVELLNDDLDPCSPSGIDCTVLRIRPLVPGRYFYSLKAVGSICGPPYSHTNPNSILVE